MAVNQYHTDADSIDYDFENDSLFLFVRGAPYAHSVNLDNIIIDFGDVNTVKGVEILHASKRFGIPKHALMKPHKIEIHLEVSDDTIELHI